jgi:MFS family permease
MGKPSSSLVPALVSVARKTKARMIKAILPVFATIAGIAFVQLANGFLGTLVATSTVTLGFVPLATGIVLAAYFGGYTIGAATIGNLLQRVGHIRLFAALAGLVAASIMTLPILPSPIAWFVARLLTGLGCAGLFITAESWLNATTTMANRGTIFAVYMVASNAAFGVGQFLINLPMPGGYELFSLAAAFFCLSLIPVCLTRSAAPIITKSPRLHISELRRIAPTALSGCATSGLASSVFYTLVPVYAQSGGTSLAAISTYMATAIFGGLVFQVPVGRLSDRMDRRLVAAGVAFGVALTASSMAFLPPSRWFFVLTFFLGGFLSTIYPLSVAHANDRVPPEHVVSTSGQLILINGIASFFGPIIGTAIMGHAGITGIFLIMATVAALFAGLSLWRAIHLDPVRTKDRTFKILNAQMSQSTAHVADTDVDVEQAKDSSPEKYD